MTPCNAGVPNLFKYAFNLNPAAADSRTLTPGTSWLETVVQGPGTFSF